MNITEHPIYMAIYNLTQEVEKLPPSKEQTEFVTRITNLEYTAKLLIDSAKETAENNDKKAGEMYEYYCACVGGKAFNGSDLPSWQSFSSDPSKKVQADAWRNLAQVYYDTK